MIRYVAILRGINVGGKRKILMADLRQLFTDLKFEDITTYIQSGNVGFSLKNKKDISELEEKIEMAILKKFELEVPVVVRTAEEIKEAVLQNPFLKEEIEIERLHLTFLKELPTSEHIEIANSFDFSPDRFKIIGQLAFGYCHGKFHESKLSGTFFERKLKVRATTRNWKTVLKLAEL
jgi:uncharacterized protein (DUF1697 family)